MKNIITSNNFCDTTSVTDNMHNELYKIGIDITKSNLSEIEMSGDMLTSTLSHTKNDEYINQSINNGCWDRHEYVDRIKQPPKLEMITSIKSTNNKASVATTTTTTTTANSNSNNINPPKLTPIYTTNINTLDNTTSPIIIDNNIGYISKSHDIESQYINNTNDSLNCYKSETIILNNKSIINSTIQNIDIQNIDIQNIDIQNIDIQNIDIQNIDIQNIDIQNIDIDSDDSRRINTNQIINTDIDSINDSNLQINESIENDNKIDQNQSINRTIDIFSQNNINNLSQSIVKTNQTNNNNSITYPLFPDYNNNNNIQQLDDGSQSVNNIDKILNVSTYDNLNFTTTNNHYTNQLTGTNTSVAFGDHSILPLRGSAFSPSIAITTKTITNNKNNSFEYYDLVSQYDINTAATTTTTTTTTTTNNNNNNNNNNINNIDNNRNINTASTCTTATVATATTAASMFDSNNMLQRHFYESNNLMSSEYVIAKPPGCGPITNVTYINNNNNNNNDLTNVNNNNIFFNGFTFNLDDINIDNISSSFTSDYNNIFTNSFDNINPYFIDKTTSMITNNRINSDNNISITTNNTYNNIHSNLSTNLNTTNINNNGVGSIKRHSSSSLSSSSVRRRNDYHDPQSAIKRHNHNMLERKRRSELRDSFTTLIELLPELKGISINRLSKVKILVATTNHINYINSMRNLRDSLEREKHKLVISVIDKLKYLSSINLLSIPVKDSVSKFIN